MEKLYVIVMGVVVLAAIINQAKSDSEKDRRKVTVCLPLKTVG